MLTVNVYIIVIYDVITIDYCKCILLSSPLNSYLYVHWILDFNPFATELFFGFDGIKMCYFQLCVGYFVIM